MSIKDEPGQIGPAADPLPGRRALNSLLLQMVQMTAQQQDAHLFKTAVNKADIRDYNLFVAEKDEMYLDKIADKASKNLYGSVGDYRFDIQGIFRNAVLYNTKGRGQQGSERMILLAAGVMGKSEELCRAFQAQLDEAEMQIKAEEQPANSRAQEYQMGSSSGPSHWSDADERQMEPQSMPSSSQIPDIPMDQREATSGSTRPGSGKLIRIPKTLVESHVGGADFPLSASLDVFMDLRHAARYIVRVYRMTDSSNAGGNEVLYSLKAAPEVHATWKACRQPRWQMDPGPSAAQPLAIRLFLTSNPNAMPVERHVQPRPMPAPVVSAAAPPPAMGMPMAVTPRPSPRPAASGPPGASPSGGTKRKKAASSSKCNVYLPRAVAEEHFGGAMFPKPAELQVFTGDIMHSSTRVRLYQHVYTGTNTACQYSVGVTANLHCLWKSNKVRIRWVVEHADRETPTIKMLLPADAAENAAAAAAAAPPAATAAASGSGGPGPSPRDAMSAHTPDSGYTGPMQLPHVMAGLPPPLLSHRSGVLGGPLLPTTSGEGLLQRRNSLARAGSLPGGGKAWPGPARAPGSTEESLARRAASGEARTMPPPPILIPPSPAIVRHPSGGLPSAAYGPLTPALSPEPGAASETETVTRSTRKRERAPEVTAALLGTSVADSPGGKRQVANKHLYLPKALVAEHFPNVSFPLSIQFDVYIGGQLHSTTPLKVYTYKTGVTESSFIYSITVRSDVHAMWKESRQHVQWTASPGHRKSDPPLVKLLLPAAVGAGIPRRSHSEGETLAASLAAGPASGRGIASSRSLPAVATPSPRAAPHAATASPLSTPLYSNAMQLAARGVVIMEPGASSHGGYPLPQMVRGVKMGAGGRPPAAQPKSRCKKAVYIPRGLAEEWFQGQAFPVSATLQICLGEQTHTALDIRVYKCLNQGADVAAKNAAYAIHVRPILHAMWRSARGLVQWEIMARPHQDPLIRMLLPQDTELPPGLASAQHDDLVDAVNDDPRHYGLRRHRLGRTASLTAAATGMASVSRRRGDSAEALPGRRGASRAGAAEPPAGTAAVRRSRRGASEPEPMEDMEAAFLLAGMRDAEQQQGSVSSEGYDDGEEFGEDDEGYLEDEYSMDQDPGMYPDEGLVDDDDYADMHVDQYGEHLMRTAEHTSLVDATDAASRQPPGASASNPHQRMEEPGIPLYLDEGIDADVPMGASEVPVEGRVAAAGAARAACWSSSWRDAAAPEPAGPPQADGDAHEPASKRHRTSSSHDMQENGPATGEADEKEDVATLLPDGSEWPPLPPAEDLSATRTAARLILAASRMLGVPCIARHIAVFSAARLLPRQMAVLCARLRDAWLRRRTDEAVSVLNALLTSGGAEEHQLVGPLKGPPWLSLPETMEPSQWHHGELPEAEGESVQQLNAAFLVASKALGCSLETRMQAVSTAVRLSGTAPALLAAAHECLADAWIHRRLDEARAVIHQLAWDA